MNRKHYLKLDEYLMDDERILFLIEEMGMEGWGIYMLLIFTLRKKAMLRSDLNTLKILIRRNELPEEATYQVVNNYKLFEFEEEQGITYFMSPDLCQAMEDLEEDEDDYDEEYDEEYDEDNEAYNNEDYEEEDDEEEEYEEDRNGN